MLTSAAKDLYSRQEECPYQLIPAHEDKAAQPCVLLVRQHGSHTNTHREAVSGGRLAEGGRASTAAMSGVRPMLASAGVSGPEPSTSAKNATPVISSTVGVMMAATPHPYCAAPRARQPRASRASASASGRVSMLHERGVPGMRDAKQWRPLAHARRTRLPAPGAAAAAAAAGARARALRKMKRDSSIMMNVTAPVADEKSPMNAE